MALSKLSKIIGFCILVAFFLFFLNKKEILKVAEIDQSKIEDFDIILSKGQSFQSKFISLLKLTAEDYSHIGIMLNQNNTVFVLHSTPDGTKTNGIRYDDLQTFINLSSVSDYQVLRYTSLTSDLRQKLRLEFESYKNNSAPFDFDFNNSDHSKIYCSELVYLIFKNSGLSTFSEIDLAKPIYPKYFLTKQEFIPVDLKKIRLQEIDN